MSVELVGEGDVAVAVEAVREFLCLVAEVGLGGEVGVSAVKCDGCFVCPALAVDRCPVVWYCLAVLFLCLELVVRLNFLTRIGYSPSSCFPYRAQIASQENPDFDTSIAPSCELLPNQGLEDRRTRNDHSCT